MLLHSTRLGDIDIPDNEIVHFPHGLPGFLNEKAFALLPYEPDSPFFVLQSATDPNLTFVLVDPFVCFKDYAFELADDVAQEMGLSADNPPRSFCIVTVRDDIAKMTANLKAPLIVNWRDRTAFQLVLEKTSYTTRARLFPQGLPAKGGK